MSLRTIVVDLDDTLIASARARARGRRHLLQYGIDGRAFAAADRRWWQLFSTGAYSIEDLRLGRLADVGVTGPDAKKIDAAYRAIGNDIRIRVGARRLLRELKAAGFRTVILTNGTVDPQRHKVERHRLHLMVDGVVVTEEIGHHKPDPRAFHAALNLVQGRPREAAMVGDTLDFDIAGALASGFQRAVWITGRRFQHPDPRVVRVSRLDQVMPALTA